MTHVQTTRDAGASFADGEPSIRVRQPGLWRSSVKELEEFCNGFPSVFGAVNAHLQERFCSLFEPFVSNVDGIGALMRESGSILSGSMVLKFLDPVFVSTWSVPPKDLDLYTPSSTHQDVVDFFVEKEGYVISRRLVFDGLTDWHAYGMNNDQVRILVTLCKGDKTVDVLGSTTECPLLPIFRFHSTAVMNALTPDIVFVAYRDITFAHRAFVNPSIPLTSRIERKWASRGVSFFGTSCSPLPNHTCRSATFCPHTVRYSLDTSSVLWNYGDVGASSFNSGWGVLWRIGGPACRIGSSSEDTSDIIMHIPELVRGFIPEPLHMYMRM